MSNGFGGWNNGHRFMASVKIMMDGFSQNICHNKLGLDDQIFESPSFMLLL